MLDTKARKFIQPIISKTAQLCIKYKITANQITITALFLGILSSILIFFDNRLMAILFMWISGFFDALDGSIARINNEKSDFGTLMDITFDRIVEICFILSLAIKNDNIKMPMIFLCSSIIFSMTIFLTVGALTEKKGMKSFYYQAGIAERTEGFIMFSLMILIPSYISLITNIFSAIIIITIFQRLNEARNILK